MPVQELERPIPVHTPEEIAAFQPEGGYTDHYQPHYDNPQDVAEAAHEVQSTETVTLPRLVDRLQSELTDLAEGRRQDPMAVTGRCAEEISLRTSISTHVEHGVSNLSIVTKKLGGTAIKMLRAMVQSAKPRSAEIEVRDGIEEPSYMGDIINDMKGNRTPDPSRMVAGVVQARDTQAGLTAATGDHVYAAHEALLLPYEMASIFEDPETGKRYLLSADMPWIGMRTNKLDGEHVKLLEGIANPIGIKIGASSNAEHIAGLQAKLNPEDTAGKLTYMLRFENHQQEELRTVVEAIAAHSPNALIMYDIHGVTKSINGQKIRAVSDIIAQVEMVSNACYDAGLTLHGVHLETIMDVDRLECVATPDQKPTHPGGVDPQLNPSQLEKVLEDIKGFLLRPKAKPLQAA